MVTRGDDQQPLCFVLIPFDVKPDPLGGPDLDFDEIYAQALKLELTASLLFGSLPGGPGYPRGPTTWSSGRPLP